MTLVLAGLIDRETAFFCADSTISANRKTLLSGFRKIYSVPVKVWEPCFIGDVFNGYQHVHTSTSCAVAFSGGTLTAQHLLNSISSHLSQLRISWCSSAMSYVMKRHCDSSNELLNPRLTWSHDMFALNNLNGIFGCDIVFETILYSINEAIRSARKYKIDEDGYRALKTSFIAAAYDPAGRETKLARFDFVSQQGADGYLTPRFLMVPVPAGEVALIGESRLVQEFARDRRAASDGHMDDMTAFNYLLKKIDEAIDSGIPVVDYPAVLKHFKSGRLEVVKNVESSR